MKQENTDLKGKLRGYEQQLMTLENVLVNEREKQYKQHKQLIEMENERDAIIRESKKMVKKIFVNKVKE